MTRLILLAAFAVFTACSSTEGDLDAGNIAGADVRDAGLDEIDAGSEAPDAGSEDAGIIPDAGAGGECSFNSDCPSWLRCECGKQTATGCECSVGPRGTGAAGTTCANENDCESAICLEGTGDVYRCSKECATGADCPAELPNCADIAFVGRICVRQP